MHKKRNILEHLPENEHLWVSRKLNQAWQDPNPERALTTLEGLAKQVEKDHPGAAASLREGLEDTLTINRLGLPEKLCVTLSSTNVIDSANDRVRSICSNVKRWRNGEQVLRWTAAAYMEAEKGFHRINGYRELPLLKEALQKQLLTKLSATTQTA